MGVRVDKARRHIEALGIDHLVRLYVAELPDCLDPVTPNEHIRVDPRITASVEYPTISNQNRPLLSSHIGHGQENQRSE